MSAVSGRARCLISRRAADRPSRAPWTRRERRRRGRSEREVGSRYSSGAELGETRSGSAMRAAVVSETHAERRRQAARGRRRDEIRGFCCLNFILSLFN